MASVTLSTAQVESVARLHDDPAILPILRRARLSRDTAFLALVVREGGADEAYQTLVRVQRQAPDVARRVMEHPRFGAWAAVASLDLRHADQLATFAASAAIQAHVPFALDVPAVDGWVVLPSLGAIPVEPSRRSVHLTGDHPDRRPLRRIRARCADERVDLELDEVPMFAVEGATLPLAAAPTEAEFDLWQRRIVAAMRLLAWSTPHLATPLARGMRTVIPLAGAYAGSRAASLSDAFGAAAMTLPGHAVAAATTLLHEFQHSKLSALSEIVPMVADDTADLYSPWRAEPRPASAVLHGAFAHLAVAQLWTRLAGRIGEAWAEAELTREQTLSACADLTASGRLTVAGRDFVTLLAETARGFDRAPTLYTRTQTAARLAAHRADWTRAQRQLGASPTLRHPDSARSESRP